MVRACSGLSRSFRRQSRFRSTPSGGRNAGGRCWAPLARPRGGRSSSGRHSSRRRLRNDRTSQSRRVACRGEGERVIVQRSLEAHYRQTREVPVPLLGSVSPRRAVGAPRRREKVAAWLKCWRTTACAVRPSDPMAGYNLSWMGQNSGSSGCGAEGSAIIVASFYGVTEFGGNWI